MYAEEREVVNTAIDILKGAAMCDGAHHKQYDIVRALKLLMGPKDYVTWLSKLEKEYDFTLDEGVP